MKRCLIAFLFIGNCCFAQKWQAEIMGGASGYNGDLTQHKVGFKSMRPGVSVNLKCEIHGIFVVRAGLAYLNVGANDKDNKDFYLNSRNLNFKSSIIEGSLGMELNIFESDVFKAYPYIFAAIGFYHFNPYTRDNEGKKYFLHDLSTEGQGLQAYPSKKPYKLTQFCIPFGGGWKWDVNKQVSIAFEVGYRWLFTDYLDDVSGFYVDAETLIAEKGTKAAELAYRQPTGSGIEGDIRGNPKVKDWYYFNGLKLIVHLGGKDR